jgi:prepilin-type processing-associated H-X9-DG protein
MRQIGMAIIMYAESEDGMLPYGYWNGLPLGDNSDVNGELAGDWAILTLNYLDGTAAGQNYEDNELIGNNKLRDVYRCPEGLVSNNAITQYSAHHRLMPNLQDIGTDPSLPNSYAEPYRIVKIDDAANKLFVADGTLQNLSGESGDGENYAAAATLYAIDNYRTFYDHFSLNWKYEEWIQTAPQEEIERNVWAGTNRDDPANWGNIKFRHGGPGRDSTDGATTNILYGDGHVAAARHAGFFPGIPDQLDSGINRRSILVPSFR